MKLHFSLPLLLPMYLFKSLTQLFGLSQQNLRSACVLIPRNNLLIMIFLFFFCSYRSYTGYCSHHEFHKIWAVARPQIISLRAWWKRDPLKFGRRVVRAIREAGQKTDCGRWDVKAILQSQYFLSCAFLHCLWRLFCSTISSTRSYKVRKMRRRTRETYSKTETCRYMKAEYNAVTCVAVYMLLMSFSRSVSIIEQFPGASSFGRGFYG